MIQTSKNPTVRHKSSEGTTPTGIVDRWDVLKVKKAQAEASERNFVKADWAERLQGINRPVIFRLNEF